MITRLREAEAPGLPEIARSVVLNLGMLLDLAREALALEHRLLAWYRQDTISQRLGPIPGVGILTATALAASVPDPSVFRSGR